MRKHRENNALFDVGDTVTTDSNEFSLDLKFLEKKKKTKILIGRDSYYTRKWKGKRIAVKSCEPISDIKMRYYNVFDEEQFWKLPHILPLNQ